MPPPLFLGHALQSYGEPGALVEPQLVLRGERTHHTPRLAPQAEVGQGQQVSVHAAKLFVVRGRLPWDEVAGHGADTTGVWWLVAPFAGAARVT
jgi:hypothetical protein